MVLCGNNTIIQDACRSVGFLYNGICCLEKGIIIVSEKSQKLQKLKESRICISKAYFNMLGVEDKRSESILDALTELYIDLSKQIKTIEKEVLSNG